MVNYHLVSTCSFILATSSYQLSWKRSQFISSLFLCSRRHLDPPPQDLPLATTDSVGNGQRCCLSCGRPWPESIECRLSLKEDVLRLRRLQRVHGNWTAGEFHANLGWVGTHMQVHYLQSVQLTCSHSGRHFPQRPYQVDPGSPGASASHSSHGTQIDRVDRKGSGRKLLH